MTSVDTFGSFPGVQVETAGGAVTGAAVGGIEKLVLVGFADTTAGSASVNEPTQIESRLGAERVFGADTQLADGVRTALESGANIDFLFGTPVKQTQVTGEAFTTTVSGTLANAPIKEDKTEITVRDTTAGTSSSDTNFVVEFRYESPPPAPTLAGSETDKVFINPNTGEWEADESADYEFDYTYGEWETALQETGTVIDNGEAGIVSPLVEAQSVASTLSTVVNDARDNYKMLKGVVAAEPNLTVDGAAHVDPDTYTNSLDNDALFVHAPTRLAGSTTLLTPALTGLMAGNPLDDSIYRDVLNVTAVGQRLSLSEADALRAVELIPIRQPPTGGDVIIAGNGSTSTETSWKRDFWRRRIVDQVILIARSIGRSVIGQINSTDTRATAQEQIVTELQNLGDDELIRTENEDQFFVEVFKISESSVGIDLGITPYGIARRVEVSLTIDN